MNSFAKFSFLTLLGLLLSVGLFAQGTTSARITGQVVSKSEALIGATVLAIHGPTGFEYGTTTNTEGLFTLNNVNVGGPYKITVSYVGYEDLIFEDIYLGLGQTETFNVELEETAEQLEEVVITAGGLFDGNRTGAETKISLDDINKLPTATRNFNDYLRVSPQANVLGDGDDGVSFTGVNNRFNSIFIDGAVNNDVFGLANSGTNGGQAGISPISPDAIEQIQVVLAPYDVTLGGFAGGGINAITRSGTNTWTGSAYWFHRNEDLAGKTPTDNENEERTKLPDFSGNTYGMRLGGPIIKNKLFFFTNVEIQRDRTPRPLVIDQYVGDSGLEDLEAIRQRLNDVYGYDPGEYENNNETIDGEKVLLKLDWSASAKHKLSLRHSYTKATTERHGQNSANSIVFGNTGSIFPSTTNSSALEVKSIFNSTISNN
ncbi:MAG: carboxypeptidase regulatory-like domain-containing protein, partial [Bacteroidota bacterium]